MENQKIAICRKCMTGTTILEIKDKKWEYCEECGTYLLMNCPGCGNEIFSTNAKCCRICGANYFTYQKA